MPLPLLTTPRTRITIANPELAQALHQFICRNREFLAPWEPLRDSDYYSIECVRKRTLASQEVFSSRLGFHFVALAPDKDRVICCINFNNIVRGAFQACHLGYCIDQVYQSFGYMTEVLAPLIEYMFDEQGLHRIMANYMPNNTRSKKLLQRLGFEEEGYAKSYLKIQGQWQDHVLTAKVKDNFK